MFTLDVKIKVTEKYENVFLIRLFQLILISHNEKVNNFEIRNIVTDIRYSWTYFDIYEQIGSLTNKFSIISVNQVLLIE